MRTTSTLDDVLVQELRQRAAATGRPFEMLVAEAIARGLATPGRPAGESYRLRTGSLGGPRVGVDLTGALQLAATREDEEWSRAPSRTASASEVVT